MRCRLAQSNNHIDIDIHRYFHNHDFLKSVLIQRDVVFVLKLEASLNYWKSIVMRHTGAAFLRITAKAILNYFTLGVGSVVIDGLVDTTEAVCKDVHENCLKDKTEAERREAIEAVAQASAAEIKQVADEVDTIEESQEELKQLLLQVQANIRRTLRRPSDPSGLTTAAWQKFDSPESLLPIIPSQRSRFHAGDQPLPGVDLQLVELLGIGGFGEVWKAINPHLSNASPVALKFCLDEAAARSLKNEAAMLNIAMQQGSHPGIVQLRHTYLSAAPPCLEYEYVEGGDLADLIAEAAIDGTGVPPEEARSIIHELATTLSVAHSAGIVHRDLKPANILIPVDAKPGEPRFKIADFGIGGLQSAIDQRTKRGHTVSARMAESLIGSHTPLYASPEQSAGQSPHPSDDVYSLGVIWYQLLTGDLNSGAPTGRRWRTRLSQLGVEDSELDLLEECFEPREDRPSNSTTLINSFESPINGNSNIVKRPSSDSSRGVRANVVDEKAERKLVEIKLPEFTEEFSDVTGELLAVYKWNAKEGERFEPGEELCELEAEKATFSLPAGESGRLARIVKQVSEPVRAGDIVGYFETAKNRIRLTSKPNGPNEQLRDGHHAGEQAAVILDDLEIELKWCPPGEFNMGSPENESNRKLDENQVDVRLTNGFWIGTTPITQKVYEGIANSNPSFFRGPQLPVDSVTWDSANDFCDELAETLYAKNFLSSTWYVRLPTESEWEFACRAETQTPFCFGSDAKKLKQFAWYFDNEAEKSIHVASLKPNPWGIYDMHGNVWEWCRDWYADQLVGGSDPQGPRAGSERVIRGGSWDSSASGCRSAARSKESPYRGGINTGFRIVLSSHNFK